jgi:tetratricopeptide (TPR) repeat protein
MLAAKSFSQLPNSEAYDAFWNADYHRALALLHNIDAPGCAVMRARSLMRLKRYDRAIAEFERRPLSSYDSHEAAQLAGLAASAFSLLGSGERAQDALGALRSVVNKSSEKALFLFDALTRCQIAMYAGDLEYSLSFVAEMADLASQLDETAPQKPHHLDFIFLRSRVLGFQALDAAFRADYPREETHLLDLVSYVSQPGSPHRDLEAMALELLAALVALRPFPKGRQYLISRLATYPWTRHTSRTENKVRQSLRNNARLFGTEDEGLALDCPTAPSLTMRLVELVDSLTLERWTDRRQFLAELRFAVSIALDIDWSNVDLEFPTVLEVGALVAPFDLAVARKAKEMYFRHLGNVPRSAVGMHEPRLAASNHFCLAGIAKSEGLYREAVRDFAAIAGLPYPGRQLAAIGGIESYTITRCTSDLEPAEWFLEHHPRSSFARRLADALPAAKRSAPGDFPYLGMYAIADAAADSVGAA